MTKIIHFDEQANQISEFNRLEGLVLSADLGHKINFVQAVQNNINLSSQLVFWKNHLTYQQHQICGGIHMTG